MDRWSKRKIKPSRKSRQKFAAYHGTTREFAAFDLNKTTFGIHVGTKEQAQSFIGVGGGRILKLDVKLKNPLRLPDLGEWDIGDIVEQLSQNPATADIQNPAFIEVPYRDYWGYFRQELMKRGYDGIVYLNREEGIDREQRNAIYAVVGRRKFAGYPPDSEIMKLAPSARDSYIVFDPADIVVEEEQKCWRADRSGNLQYECE